MRESCAIFDVDAIVSAEPKPSSGIQGQGAHVFRMQAALPGKMLELNAVATNGGMRQPHGFVIRDPKCAIRRLDHLVEIIGFQTVSLGKPLPISVVEPQQAVVTRKPETAVLVR